MDEAIIKNQKDFVWESPSKYFSLDDVGDLHLQWLIDRYAALRLKQRLPLFNRAFDLMTERGNYSRKNAFGEMHGDCFMWIEKCEHSRVICYENQSQRLLFIALNTYGFHIRYLAYKYSWIKGSHKESKLETFKRTDFKQTNENPAFQFCDARDEGYAVSTDGVIHPKVDAASMDALSVIGLMDFWEPYLDDPTTLE